MNIKHLGPKMNVHVELEKKLQVTNFEKLTNTTNIPKSRKITYITN